MSRRYSLIIPTRNRQSTAIFAIISALGVRFDNFEVIVSDNSDDDSLYTFLRDQDLIGQIRYHKTERVLSMTENWERGIELSTGDVLSVIGPC